MEDAPHRHDISHFFSGSAWIYRGLIMTFLVITLLMLLLFFNVRWWIIFLPILILTVPLSRWSLYQSYEPRIISSTGDPAAIKIVVI